MKQWVLPGVLLLGLLGTTLLSAQTAPRHSTMEQLHQGGGVPPGWRFTLPPGDAMRGKALFATLECYRCHVVAGAGFPTPGGDATHTGPELTGMGAHHPAEYFAESIIDPNAVVLAGPGFTGPDGRSIMPSYADSLTVAQLQDLVAYLASLTQQAPGATGAMHEHGAGGSAHDHQHADAGVERAETAGPYDLRLVQDEHAHRLMLFVTDSDSGEAVPYLPVSASIDVPGRAARSLRLAPATGADGFHYGAAATVPERTRRITVAIGPAAMQTLEPLRGRFSRRVTAVFNWTASR